MRLWAFGTSPHGLGLKPEVFWCLNGSEFRALKELYDADLNRWAIERAHYANVHFIERDDKGKATGVPFEPADFLGTGNREKRKVQSLMDKVELTKLNARLARIVPGAPPDESIPAWARGDGK